MDVKEFARLGGLARAKKLTKEQLIEAARKAGRGNAGKKRKPKPLTKPPD
jgi:hypothetical protein